MEKNLVKINVNGGILSTGRLGEILGIARHFGAGYLHFGERQNIYFDSSEKNRILVNDYFEDKNIEFEFNTRQYPNMTSSYISEDIFTTHPWVSEGMYQDILNSFEYKTKLKINIVDPTQGLVPLFTGHLNFVCSLHMNFWYLYIKHPSMGGMVCYPTLIYTNHIGALSEALEKELEGSLSIDLPALAKQINEQHKFIVMDVDQELSLSRIRFPNYEGLNRLGDKFLLGIYRRSNDFAIDFLEAITELCRQTRIGQICITPWQSILIKGIKENDRILWEKLLGKYGVNIRHSALELNWQIPDLDQRALELKKFLVREFDERDIRTYGLSFAIKTNPMDVASSVIIEELVSEVSDSPNALYTIKYAEDFNANSQVFKVYEENVEKTALPDVLERLSRKYYEQLNAGDDQQLNIENKEEKKSKTEKLLYQCKSCFTIYDSVYGDDMNDIPPGVAFSDLPESYCCPVCDGAKSDFVLKKMSLNGKVQ